MAAARYVRYKTARKLIGEHGIEKTHRPMGRFVRGAMGSKVRLVGRPYQRPYYEVSVDGSDRSHAQQALRWASPALSGLGRVHSGHIKHYQINEDKLDADPDRWIWFGVLSVISLIIALSVISKKDQ